MASKKRLQPGIQIPKLTTEVVSAPTNTFVAPGLEGAPQAPTTDVAPTPPGMQDVLDLQNMAKAYGALSGSIASLGAATGQLTRAERIGAEKEGKLAGELADIENWQKNFDESFFKGNWKYGDHPAFYKAASRAFATKLARENSILDKGAFPAFLNTDAAKADPDAGVKWFDKQTDNVLSTHPLTPDRGQGIGPNFRLLMRSSWLTG